MKSIFTCLAITLLISRPTSACSPCSDVVDSFAGTVITSGVVLTWHADAEESGQYYKLLRYACSDLQCQPALVALVPSQGPCTTLREYEREDDPGAGSWYYSLEVYSSANVRLCTADLPEIEVE